MFAFQCCHCIVPGTAGHWLTAAWASCPLSTQTNTLMGTVIQTTFYSVSSKNTKHICVHTRLLKNQSGPEL